MAGSGAHSPTQRRSRARPIFSREVKRVGEDLSQSPARAPAPPPLPPPDLREVLGPGQGVTMAQAGRMWLGGAPVGMRLPQVSPGHGALSPIASARRRNERVEGARRADCPRGCLPTHPPPALPHTQPHSPPHPLSVGEPALR